MSNINPSLQLNPLSQFYGGQTANDAWLLASPSYNEQWGFDPWAGNLTTDPELNQLINGMAAEDPYGKVPLALIANGGNPNVLNQLPLDYRLESPLNYRKGPVQTKVSQAALGSLTQAHLAYLQPPPPHPAGVQNPATFPVGGLLEFNLMDGNQWFRIP